MVGSQPARLSHAVDGRITMLRFVLLIGLAIVGTALPAQAQVVLRDIYRAAGVVASAGATGLGAAIHCTNSATASAAIRVLIYRHDALLMGNTTVSVAPGRTTTIVTGATALFPSGVNLNTGSVFQGQAVIRSDTNEVFCSIVVLDRDNPVPRFMTRLHMVKFPRGGGED